MQTILLRAKPFLASKVKTKKEFIGSFKRTTDRVSDIRLHKLHRKEQPLPTFPVLYQGKAEKSFVIPL